MHKQKSEPSLEERLRFLLDEISHEPVSSEILRLARQLQVLLDEQAAEKDPSKPKPK